MGELALLGSGDPGPVLHGLGLLHRRLQQPAQPQRQHGCPRGHGLVGRVSLFPRCPAAPGPGAPRLLRDLGGHHHPDQAGQDARVPDKIPHRGRHPQTHRPAAEDRRHPGARGREGNPAGAGPGGRHRGRPPRRQPPGGRGGRRGGVRRGRVHAERRAVAGGQAGGRCRRRRQHQHRGAAQDPRPGGRQGHGPGPDHPPGPGGPGQQGADPGPGGPGGGHFRAGHHCHRFPGVPAVVDDQRRFRFRDDPPGGGAGHRLPLRPGARNPHGHHGRHGQGRRARNPLQNQRSPGEGQQADHRRARQDRHHHPRQTHRGGGPAL